MVWLNLDQAGWIIFLKGSSISFEDVAFLVEADVGGQYGHAIRLMLHNLGDGIAQQLLDPLPLGGDYPEHPHVFVGQGKRAVVSVHLRACTHKIAG